MNSPDVHIGAVFGFSPLAFEEGIRLGLVYFSEGSKNMIKELDVVVLARDLNDYQLKRGDVGTVVHVHESGKAYEVEFLTDEGKTVAVVTLSVHDLYSSQDFIA